MILKELVLMEQPTDIWIVLSTIPIIFPMAG